MPTRILRLAAVREITGLARSTLYELIGRGEFPRPVKLTGKAVGWPETDVVAWLESRPKAD